MAAACAVKHLDTIADTFNIDPNVRVNSIQGYIFIGPYLSFDYSFGLIFLV